MAKLVVHNNKDNINITEQLTSSQRNKLNQLIKRHFKTPTLLPVSYTHLDVYKRQVIGVSYKRSVSEVAVCRKEKTREEQIATNHRTSSETNQHTWKQRSSNKLTFFKQISLIFKDSY